MSGEKMTVDNNTVPGELTNSAGEVGDVVHGIEVELLRRIKKMESPEYCRDAISFQSTSRIWTSSVFYILLGLLTLAATALVLVWGGNV